MNYSVIIVAAGVGKRCGLNYNKVFYNYQGKTLIERVVASFNQDEDCKEIIVVVNPKELADFEGLLKSDKVIYANGGKERQDSVRNGLTKVNQKYVLIQDGARCFLKQECLNDIKDTLKEEDACLLMVPVVDTIKEVNDGYVVKTFKRSSLMAAQTPQAFKTSLIKKCHQLASDDNFIASDDAMLVEKYGKSKVKVVMGSYDNIKITTPTDLK